MSSPFLTQFRKGGISREMRLTAASGALPLSAVDQVELLSLLSRDRDRKVSLGAISSLKSLEVALVTSVIKEPSINPEILSFFGRHSESNEIHEAVVRNPNTSDSVIAFLVPQLSSANLEFVVMNQTRLLRCPEILNALEASENLNAEQRRLIRELRSDFKLELQTSQVNTAPVSLELFNDLDLETGPPEQDELMFESAEFVKDADEERKTSLLSQLVVMSVADKVLRALKGEREARLMLVRDRNRSVWSAALSSPKMNEADAEQISKMRNVAPDVLREIAKNRQWTKRYAVVHELVKNPKTPPEISCNLLARLTMHDLKSLFRDRNVSEQVRHLASKRGRANR